MRLTDLKQATDLARRREVLLRQIDAVSVQSIEMQIGGLYVDPEIIESVLPEIVTKLQRLAAGVESDLLKLGVRLH